MKFRKRPVVVEATQWFRNGDHPEDYKSPRYDISGGVYGTPLVSKEYSAEYARLHNWEGDVVRYFRDPGMDGTKRCSICDQLLRNHGWLDMVGGGAKVCPGDWIITGVQGERYPCKPDVFKLTCEPAED